MDHSPRATGNGKMIGARLLMVEDEERIARFVAEGLLESGYQVVCLPDAERARDVLAREAFDLLILDLLLPGMSGMELCRLVRGQGLEIPILVLTALDSVEDRVDGLRNGADDYLGKPFRFEELLARVEALLRRGPLRELVTSMLLIDDLEIDLRSLSATRGARKLDLTPTEFRLLEHLLRNRGRVCTRENILENVWSGGNTPTANIVDVHVSHLRRKVDADTDCPLVHTVRGFGYKIDDSN